MKEFEGTPGEWNINHWSNGQSGVACVQLNKDGISYYTGDAVSETHYGIRSKIEPSEHNNFGSFEGAHIADIAIPCTDEGRKEAEANARLIASAPEMLDILIQIAEARRIGNELALSEIEDVIDKALGIQ